MAYWKQRVSARDFNSGLLQGVHRLRAEGWILVWHHDDTSITFYRRPLGYLMALYSYCWRTYQIWRIRGAS